MKTKPSGKNDPCTSSDTAKLHAQLASMHMPYVDQHFESLGQQAALDQSAHVDYLAQLIDGECCRRDDRTTQRRIALAHLPVLKTLEQFDWSWPTSINQLQVRHLFRLGFLEEKGNVILIGTVGLGKSHLATALAHTACLQRKSALFVTATEIINSLAASQASGGFKREMQKYLKPSILVVDELGYIPIDKFGADCLFQIISARYEQSSTIVTSNRAFKNWAEIFNNDSTLTSALLDRLLHHAETVLIEGQSYRMKDQIDNLKT
jgi:DNA replication protein DnaC